MTRIYTMTHKKYKEPDNNIYIPLQVGRANNAPLGYLGDDTGDNISALNCYYGELTGIYWMWKNLDYSGNVGICHYRRFFINNNKDILSEDEYDTILSEYDIITTKALECEDNYREYYGKAHPVEVLDITGEIIKELYPDYYVLFEKVMGHNRYYFANMMAAPKKIFDDYCEWLFSILFELEKHIDLNGYDEYQTRVFGFISENLLMVYIKTRNLKCYECPVMLTDEKAETKELKLAVGQLIKLGRIKESFKLFYDVLDIRPDISLKASDISGEIPIIAHIVDILNLEENMNIEDGMYAYSTSLDILIRHVRKLRELLKNYESFSDEDITYMKSTNTTEAAIEIISKNDNCLSENWKNIIEMYRTCTK